MTCGSDLAVRALTPADEPALASFQCRAVGEPWAQVIEEMVRDRLAYSLSVGEAAGLGGLVGTHLVAVCAWTRAELPAGLVWRSAVLAVRTDYRRRGFGRRLKAHMIELARAAGAVAIVSDVHWDNDAMLRLNQSFGANLERVAGDDEFARCVISLR